jgi:hypothetical protein
MSTTDDAALDAAWARVLPTLPGGVDTEQIRSWLKSAWRQYIFTQNELSKAHFKAEREGCAKATDLANKLRLALGDLKIVECRDLSALTVEYVDFYEMCNSLQKLEKNLKFRSRLSLGNGNAKPHEQLLYRRILWVWTEQCRQQLKTSRTDSKGRTGPLPRFFRAATESVLDTAPGPERARKIIENEKQVRRKNPNWSAVL